MVPGQRGAALMNSPDRQAIASELWWANVHKAGYRACCVTVILGGVLVFVLATEFVQPSTLAVACTLTFAAWMFLDAFQFWFEWRTDIQKRALRVRYPIAWPNAVTQGC